jgi:hypothetical protein
MGVDDLLAIVSLGLAAACAVTGRLLRHAFRDALWCRRVVGTVGGALDREGVALPRTLPWFRAYDPDGKVVVRESLRGMASLLLFIDTGDGQQPLGSLSGTRAFETVYQMHDARVYVILVGRHARPGALSGLCELDRRLHVLYDAEATMLHAFRIPSLPAAVRIDAAGRILTYGRWSDGGVVEAAAS